MKTNILVIDSIYMSVDQRKEAFLNRYNVPRTAEHALSKAIGAASQHNPLYINGFGQPNRIPIRQFWSKQLVDIAKKYEDIQNVSTFENDVITLKTLMNGRFGQHFRVNGDQTGFRISHSQKSISVYLKHLWCMNLIAAPPICPVDRIVLGIAGHANHPVPWTKVNTMEQHRDHFQLLLTAMEQSGVGHPNISHWEILNFEA